MKLLPRTLALLAFAVAMTVTAQKDSSSGGTNDVTQTGGAVTNVVGEVGGGSTNDVTQFDGGTTNTPPLGLAGIARPPTSQLPLHLIERWSRRGAWKDGIRVNFDDDWCFPYGTEHLRSVELWAQGSVYPNAHDPMPIVSLGVPLALEPGVSEVSYFRGADGAYVFDWVRGHPNRDAGNSLDGRIALYRNGDIAVTTNGVTEVHPRMPDFAQDGYGQCETWVRANFTNAEEILSVGYTNWVNREIGTGLTNGLYRFTATFRSCPPEAIRLDVGELTVAVTNAGMYAFVLEKGLEYEFGTDPYFADVDYAAVDDIPPPRPSLQAAADWSTWTIDPGRLTLLLPEEWNYGFCSWTPALKGAPDIFHLGPSDFPLSLFVDLYDCRHSADISFDWTAGEGLMISSDGGSNAILSVGSGFPSWRRLSVSVSTSDFGELLHSKLTGASYGEYDSPQTNVRAEVPSALLLHSRWAEGSVPATASVTFTSDIPRSGEIRVALVGAAGRVNVTPGTVGVHAITDESTYGLQFEITGIERSTEVSDVGLSYEFVDSQGVSVCSNCVGITVVEPIRIAVAPMSGRGLAVLRGTDLNMSVVCEPAGATIPLVQWFDAKMHADGTYTAWREYAERGMSISRTMAESGIFLLKAHTVFPGPQQMPVYFLRMQDDFLGPYEEGEHDRIGVASEQWQLDLCTAAAAQLGSTAYARNAYLPARNGFSEVLKDKWKCNAFVADMAISVGISVPQQHVSSNVFWTHAYPPVANEWANGNVSISGWEYLGRSPWPEPGFIVGHPATQGSGHVGIVDYDGEGIGAGITHVNRKYKFIDGTSGFNRYRGVESLNQSN